MMMSLQQARGPASRRLRPPFVLRPFVPFDPATLPPREWLYGRHYQRRTVGGTVAPGGIGKTTLCMVEGVAMATARNLLGEQPRNGCGCGFTTARTTSTNSTAALPPSASTSAFP